MFYALGGLFAAVIAMFMKGCALSARSQCAARKLSHGSEKIGSGKIRPSAAP